MQASASQLFRYIVVCCFVSRLALVAEQQAQTESLPQVIYRAVGWVAGIYKPGPEKIYQGVFVSQEAEGLS